MIAICHSKMNFQIQVKKGKLMPIFTKSTVIGLAATDKQITQVLNNLNTAGILDTTEEDLTLLSRSRLEDKALSVQQGPITLSASSGANLTDVPPVTVTQKDWPAAGPAQRTIEQAKTALNDLGLSGDDVAFYAQQIARDNTVVVLQVSKNNRSAARDAFAKADLSNIITP
jgi:hypothetical protein